MRPVLSQDELRRRIRAARVLADVSQTDMNAGGHERGLPKNTLGKVERGDLDVRHVHLAMLCEILQVPMSWFTEPRDIIVGRRLADYQAVIEDLEDAARRLSAADPPPTSERAAGGPLGLRHSGASGGNASPRQPRQARGQGQSRRRAP